MRRDGTFDVPCVATLKDPASAGFFLCLSDVGAFEVQP